MNAGDTIARVIALLMALVLVGAGLVRRKQPVAKTLRLALIWLGIMIGLWAAVSFALRSSAMNFT